MLFVIILAVVPGSARQCLLARKALLFRLGVRFLRIGTKGLIQITPLQLHSTIRATKVLKYAGYCYCTCEGHTVNIFVTKTTTHVPGDTASTSFLITMEEDVPRNKYKF
jgi:hypothetical protein